MQDLQSIVTILQENAIESDKDIYNGRSLKELAEYVYDGLLDTTKFGLHGKHGLQPIP